MSTSITSIWQRIDQSLSKFAPAIGRALRPPLQDDSLRDWLQQLAQDAPSLAASYAIHDGSKSAGGIFARLPRPAAASFAQSATWIGGRVALDDKKRLQELGVSMHPIGFVGSRRRVPAYEDVDGECFQSVVVEPRSEQLFALIYEEIQPPVRLIPLNLTWPAYLEALATELETGRFEAFRDEYRVLRLVERARLPKNS